MSINDLLSPHIKHGVLSLKSLKNSNIPLYNYIRMNKNYIEESLNINVLDDLSTIRGFNKIKYFLLFYYGEEINLTTIRNEHIIIYNRICAMGVPEEVVKQMGLKCYYNRKISNNELIDELKSLAVNGVIKQLPKRLDNKIRYECNKRNMTVRQYIESLGFILEYKIKGQNN